ncbi:hypothetical protein FSP39_005700 [Pinctada imbricata]|uniref:Ig-like domain-containing protein n=1 Tax=Pinctada imbricata TaxID=66713 RepID=A0AA89BW56_PINIB|nr:hypothetical protein FSP39_005700 [Pinctada imbricata]
MKLFRLRFIILGLLLCVFHVWCRTCGTNFTSPADSAYLSQVTLEGQVSKVWGPAPSGRYNITIRIRRVRKGDDLLINGKKTKLLKIGEFGDSEDTQLCVTSITKSKQKYFFFLKSATNSQLPSDFLKLSAFPVAVSKKSGRAIRKITCRRCAKKPVLKKIRSKDVREGRRIKLGCRVKQSRPPPTFRWEKDGVEIKKSKRIKIKSNKRGSRLTIRKALKTDGGEYRCIATNVVGESESVASFKESTTPPRYKPCKPQDKDYCLNGGQCRLIVDLGNTKSCVRRRERFLKRRELKRLEKSNSLGHSTNTFHSPYSLENSMNFPIFAKMNFARQNTITTDTQTDDIGLPQPNVNPNVNMYLNPLENEPERKQSVGQRNSRSRLSAVSLGGGKTSSPPNSPDKVFNPLHRITDKDKDMIRKEQVKPTIISEPSSRSRSRGSGAGSDSSGRRRGEVPRINIQDSGSDVEDSAEDRLLEPLRISEGSLKSSNSRRSKNKTQSDTPPKFRSSDQQYRAFNKRYPKSSSRTSSESPSTSVEELTAQFNHCNGSRRGSARNCSDSISWNERGSPEHQQRDVDTSLEDPRYRKDYYSKFPNTVNGERTSYNAVCEDEPSIPI